MATLLKKEGNRHGFPYLLFCKKHFINEYTRSDTNPEFCFAIVLASSLVAFIKESFNAVMSLTVCSSSLI